jgi:hypothetical protein
MSDLSMEDKKIQSSDVQQLQVIDSSSLNATTEHSVDPNCSAQNSRKGIEDSDNKIEAQLPSTNNNSVEMTEHSGSKASTKRKEDGITNDGSSISIHFYIT